MKKIILITGLIVGGLFLSGCIKQETKPLTIGSDINNTGGIDNSVIQIKENKDISLQGIVASGITIPGNNIYISGNVLIYNDIFTIKIPNKGLIQWDFYNTYGDTLNLTDKNLTNLQINKDTLSENNNCNYNFEEGVLSISKSNKIKDGKKINLANILFEITGPDIDKPLKSWQSFLCFIDGETVYGITVSDDSKFRTDIINSFKFLK